MRHFEVVRERLPCASNYRELFGGTGHTDLDEMTARCERRIGVMQSEKRDTAELTAFHAVHRRYNNILAANASAKR